MLEKEFNVIIFDVFGTLVRIGQRRSPYKKMLKWLKENGRKPDPADSATVMSINGGFEDIAKYWGVQLSSSLLTEMEQDLLFELEEIALYEDTIESLTWLRQAGYGLGLCSNTAQPYGKRVQSLLPAFDLYAWSYELGLNKPDPKIYEFIIQNMNCSANQILFIGDTPIADVVGPSLCGMSSRLINRKEGQKLIDVIADLL